MKEYNKNINLLNPFHLAIPVHDLKLAKEFYGKILGFTEGRSSTKW
jgi:extradiol dioxygenase family protein